MSLHIHTSNACNWEYSNFNPRLGHFQKHLSVTGKYIHIIRIYLIISHNKKANSL